MTKYAILIAVEDYLDPALGNAAHRKSDAEAFSKVLALHGFAEADQLLLINSQATKTIIESKVRKLVNRLQPSDILYFYYAGHGFSKGADNFITCCDTLDSDRDDTSVGLGPILSQFRAAKCERIVLFLDCCQLVSKAPADEADEYDDLNEQELQACLDSIPHGVCFAACRSDEGSWPSDALHHGIWSYHVIKAFNGDDPLALEQGILTAESLQTYLESEVPRTLRNTYSTPKKQTPWMYGAGGDVVLADLQHILEERLEKTDKDVSLLTELSFTVAAAAELRSLSGWKKDYRIPDRYSDASEAFVVKCATDELKADIDRVYGALKEAFSFGRRELEASGPEDGVGAIITPHFNYSVTVALNPDELDEVIWTRTIDAITSPPEISSKAFAEVFDNVFDSLVFSLPAKVSIEDFIDAVEAVKSPHVKITYDRDATYCELHLKGAAGTVTLRSNSLSIVHTRPRKTKQLIASFDTIRQLVQKHNVPLISFTAAKR